MSPIKSLGNSRAKYNYKFGETGIESAGDPPPIPPVDWYFSETTPMVNGYGIAYGSNKFVAVANGMSMTSTNGITGWSDANNNFPSGIINDVTYGGGLFVAVGDGGRAYTSSNGVNWTQQTAAATNNWEGVTYGDGKWVAVSSNGTIVGSTIECIQYSTNGTSWTIAASPNVSLGNVAYGNGYFIAVSTSGKINYSTDASTWTEVPYGTGQMLFEAVAYGNGMWVVVGQGGNAWYSPTGTSNWSAAGVIAGGPGAPINFTSVTFGNGYFVAVGGTGGLAYSSDGINWTQLTQPSTPGNTSLNWKDVIYGDRKFVAVADGYTGGSYPTNIMYAFSYERFSNE